MEDLSLILDIDDTLVQTSKTALEKERLVAEKLGLNRISDQDFFALFGLFPFEQCVARWHPGVDLEAYSTCYKQTKNLRPYRAIGNPGAVISGLIKTHRVGILTNGSRQKTNEKLTAAGISDEIRQQLSFVFCSDNLGFRKPDPRVFEKAVAVLKSRPEQIYYVGDCVDDFKAASGANINFIAVLSGFTPKRKLIEAGVDESRIIPDIEALPEMILTLK